MMSITDPNIQPPNIFQMMTYITSVSFKSIFTKVRTFWETHKIWKNLPHGFDKSADVLSKRQNQEEDLFKLCVLLKKSKL